jgi:hypothetical protein
LSLKASLKNRPVIYEIVPPRREASKFNTELKGVEDVLKDNRILAINIPELINRREAQGGVLYSPATIPPEEYAMLVGEYKESIVNVIAPRLSKGDFLARARRILREDRIPNLVVVGKERKDDRLPGPGVIEAIGLLQEEKKGEVALGGICIFGRETESHEEYEGNGTTLNEATRVWLKEQAGCDFVTSQITFDSESALGFLAAYQKLCDDKGTNPLTVFVSITTVPTQSILTLIEGLDVVIPPETKKALLGSTDMGRESARVAADVFREVVAGAERLGLRVPLGLQIEQVGVNSGELSLELLDMVYPVLNK